MNDRNSDPKVMLSRLLEITKRFDYPRPDATINPLDALEGVLSETEGFKKEMDSKDCKEWQWISAETADLREFMDECETPKDVADAVYYNFPNLPNPNPFPPGPMHDAFDEAVKKEWDSLFRSEAYIDHQERQGPQRF